MIRVLAAKLAGYKSFHKFLGLQVVAVFLLIYVASRFTSLDVQGSDLDVSALFTRPAAWRTGAAATRWLFFIPAFFVIQFVCAELELRLVRAQVIAGLDRVQILLGWVLLGVSLSLVGVVATVASTLVFAHGSGVDGLAEACVGLGVYGSAFLCFAVLAAVALQKPVPALVALLMWPMIVEPLIGYLLNKYGYGGAREHLPFAALSQVVGWPDLKAAPSLPLGATLEACAFGALAAALAGLRLQRLDL